MPYNPDTSYHGDAYIKQGFDALSGDIHEGLAKYDEAQQQREKSQGVFEALRAADPKSIPPDVMAKWNSWSESQRNAYLGTHITEAHFNAQMAQETANRQSQADIAKALNDYRYYSYMNPSGEFYATQPQRDTEDKLKVAQTGLADAEMRNYYAKTYKDYKDATGVDFTEYGTNPNTDWDVRKIPGTADPSKPGSESYIITSKKNGKVIPKELKELIERTPMQPNYSILLGGQTGGSTFGDPNTAAQTPTPAPPPVAGATPGATPGPTVQVNPSPSPMAGVPEAAAMRDYQYNISHDPAHAADYYKQAQAAGFDPSRWPTQQ